MTFTITIWWGTQGQLAHEDEHLSILQNYLHGRTQYYSETYERIYPSKEECGKAERGVDRDLATDWREINKLQQAHDDWLQNAIQWIYDLF